MEHFGGKFAVFGDAGVGEKGLDFFRDSGGHIIGTAGHGHLFMGAGKNSTIGDDRRGGNREGPLSDFTSSRHLIYSKTLVRGRSSVVERHVANVNVVSSNLIARF